MDISTRLPRRCVLTAAILASILPAFAAFAQQTPAPQGNGIRRESTVRQIPSGEWTGPRLADGQPDVHGFWSNTIGNHNNWTDPQGALPGETPPAGPREKRAPSRVSDPADGQVPFQPWAKQKQQELMSFLHHPVKPEYIEPLARCAPGGVPKSLIWHGYEIRQYPGYVLFLFDSGTRIIHLDGKPHLPQNIKLWNAGSRGRWEGNTLIVDVSNNNAKARFGRTGELASENVHIEERYIFDNGGKHFNYVARITDPTVYTRPWTTTIPARRYTEADEPDGWHFDVALVTREDGKRVIEHSERICVENNGPFGAVAVPSTSAQ